MAAVSYPVPLASVPSTRVELHISCEKLRDMDVFSKSDPIVSVRVKDAGSKSWREVRLAIPSYTILSLGYSFVATITMCT